MTLQNTEVTYEMSAIAKEGISSECETSGEHQSG